MVTLISLRALVIGLLLVGAAAAGGYFNRQPLAWALIGAVGFIVLFVQ